MTHYWKSLGQIRPGLQAFYEIAHWSADEPDIVETMLRGVVYRAADQRLVSSGLIEFGEVIEVNDAIANWPFPPKPRRILFDAYPTQAYNGAMMDVPVGLCWKN